MNHHHNILVVGATGGSGRRTIDCLLAAGHRVTAFSRHASALRGQNPHLKTLDGDATRLEDIERALPGHDAVIVTLGITENPLRVRLFGASSTPGDVRSAGTRNVIAAMRRHGVRRLLVLSSFGVGATRNKLRWMDSLVFRLLLRPQILDTERQEEAVRESGLDWTLAQPVHLTDAQDEGLPFVSRAGEVRGWQISRRRVAEFFRQALQQPGLHGHSVALSSGEGS